MNKFLTTLGLTLVYLAVFHLLLVDIIGCNLSQAAFIVACIALAHE